MSFYYCERTSIYAFAEPINTISNLAFILCGLYLIFKKDMKLNIFPYLIIFIGIGSFLFHLLPTKTFSTLDIFSIILFVFSYNYVLNKNVLGKSPIYSLLSSIFVIIASFYLGKLLLNTIIGSSSFYLGLLIYMIFMMLLTKKNKNAKYFLFATLLFTASILIRSIDFYVCNYFKTGSHFIWHILNSIVLYLLVMFLSSTNRTSPKKPS